MPQELNPTGIIVVPRICNRIYDRVMSMISQSNWFVRNSLQICVRVKARALRVHGVFKHWLWDRLVFARIPRRRLGTRIAKIMSGSAPLAPEVRTVMRIVFGCPVYEGLRTDRDMRGFLFRFPRRLVKGRTCGRATSRVVRPKKLV